MTREWALRIAPTEAHSRGLNRNSSRRWGDPGLADIARCCLRTVKPDETRREMDSEMTGHAAFIHPKVVFKQRLIMRVSSPYNQTFQILELEISWNG